MTDGHRSVGVFYIGHIDEHLLCATHHVRCVTYIYKIFNPVIHIQGGQVGDYVAKVESKPGSV